MFPQGSSSRETLRRPPTTSRPPRRSFARMAGNSSGQAGFISWPWLVNCSRGQRWHASLYGDIGCGPDPDSVSDELNSIGALVLVRGAISLHIRKAPAEALAMQFLSLHFHDLYVTNILGSLARSARPAGVPLAIPAAFLGSGSPWADRLG